MVSSENHESFAPYVDVAETHSGAVLFVGDRAFKLKKPLDLGFVDYRSVEQRRHACEEEVRLNRRLAPDVYLGVGSLRSVGTDEPVVVMRRLPEERRLARLIEAGSDAEQCVRRVAHLLAAFHSTAERTDIADRAAGAESTLARWEDNVSEMQPYEGRYFAQGVLDSLHDDASRYVAGRQTLLERRVLAGRARDGHGDLLAQDIFCLAEGPAVLDCLEFDEELRGGDVLADAAFLAMDLERLGHAELSWSFLKLHRDLLGDDWPESLAHHHIAYRAQVRAKVACIRASQGATTDEDPDALLALATRHLRMGRVQLIMVGGLPGSGKSTIAAEVAQRLGAVVLASDEVRKELAGIPALESAAAAPGEGIYDVEHTSRTYGEIVARAGRLLQMGESVVVDATFTDGEVRETVRQLAARTSSRLVELQCTAPTSVLADRVARRAAAGPRVSDADGRVVRALESAAAPWPEATLVDTTRSLEVSVQAAMDVADRARWSG